METMTANEPTTATDEKAPSISSHDVLDCAAANDEPFLTPDRVAEHADGDPDNARAQLEEMERDGLLHSRKTGGVRIWWFEQHTPGDLDDVREWRQTETQAMTQTDITLAERNIGGRARKTAVVEFELPDAVAEEVRDECGDLDKDAISDRIAPLPLVDGSPV